ncbi:MAG: alanine racemase [Dokdonia sp.]|jgi:alanine racemase
MTATRLEIDLNALAHNVAYLKSQIAPEIKMMGVVKAFGYGSDAVAVALKLQDLDLAYLAVAYVPEGVALRKAGVRLPILVLHPQPENFQLLLEHCLEPSLYSPRLLKSFIAFAKAEQQKNYPVHIKINTGLNRLGFWENDVDFIADQCQQTTAVKVASIFSHLAASEDPKERPFTLHQISSFKNSAQTLCNTLGYQPFLHQSNTSAILNYPEAHFDMVRTGIGMYGYGNEARYDAILKPVASLYTTISQIHQIEPGESVGYNRAFKASTYMKTATLPLGHADGISRSLGNGKGHVVIAGKKAPIIGNVCMDMIMVDITGIPCKEGDQVVVFGADHKASALAEEAATISYELLTAISQRVKRVFIGHPQNS